MILLENKKRKNNNYQVNKSKLKKEFKNWRELCDSMEWHFSKSLNVRKSQEKSLSTICKWHKDGHKVIIDIVYEKPLEKETKVKTYGERYKQFNVKKEYEHSMMVYIIKINNEVYIGSTKEPKKRFFSHLTNANNDHKTTYDLLKRGAIFSPLKIFSDEKEMREYERQLIKKYSKDKNYICRNKQSNEEYMIKKNRNKKFLNIKVNIEDSEKIIQLLIDNNIDYKIR